MRGWWRRAWGAGPAVWRALAPLLAVVAVVMPAAWFASSAQPESVRVVAAHGHTVQVVSFELDGRERRYLLYVPPGIAPGPHALLVALHPLHRDGATFEAMSLLDHDAAANDAVVAYPDGVAGSWDAGTCCGAATRDQVDDVRFLVQVVHDVAGRVPVDPARVAVTGFSNGGLMSYRLVCERPDVFHAAVTVAGDFVGSRCSPSSPVRLLAVHGAVDRVIPLPGVAWSHLDAHGFPSAAASAERVAAADGCTGATSSTDGDLVHWSATGCPDGATVELLTHRRLSHHYPAGPADAHTYGLDMSRLTWSFLRFQRPA